MQTQTKLKLFSATAAAISAALTGHSRCRLAVATAVGATDALVPALLSLYNIGSCKTHNSKHNCYYNNIDHISAPLVSEKRFFDGIGFCFKAQHNNYADHCKNSNQTANKTCAKSAGSNESTYLIHQERQSIAGGKL